MLHTPPLAVAMAVAVAVAVAAVVRLGSGRGWGCVGKKSGRAEVGRTAQSRPLGMTNCGYYVPPGKLPFHKLLLPPLPHPWRFVTITYGRVTAALRGKTALISGKMFTCHPLVQNYMIAQRWAGAAGPTPRGSPILGRRGGGAAPFCWMEVVGCVPMCPPGGEERNGRFRKTKRWSFVQGEEVRVAFSPPLPEFGGAGQGRGGVERSCTGAPPGEEEDAVYVAPPPWGDTLPPRRRGGERETCLGRGVRENTGCPPPCGGGV